MLDFIGEGLFLRGIGGRRRGGPVSPVVTLGLQGYSTRKMRPDYDGPCIKVRRSSDGTTLDVGFSGRWLDTSAVISFVGAGDGFVDTWYDQIGSAHVSNVTTAAQPRIALSGAISVIGSDPAPYFDGNAYLFAASVPYSASAISALTLLRRTAKTKTYNNVWAYQSAGIVFSFPETTAGNFDAGDVFLSGAASTGVASPVAVANDPVEAAINETHIWEAYLSASRAAITVDGQPIAMGTNVLGSPTSQAASNFCIGTGNTGSSNRFEGYIGELAIFDNDVWGLIDNYRAEVAA